MGTDGLSGDVEGRESHLCDRYREDVKVVPVEPTGP